MGRKCFISFKKEDNDYRQKVIDLLGNESYIDKSLDRVIQSEDGDYIMRALRLIGDYISQQDMMSIPRRLSFRQNQFANLILITSEWTMLRKKELNCICIHKCHRWMRFPQWIA